MRIGLFGGSFDPPHIAHLILAEYALNTLSLDGVLWAPAADQPFKHHDGVSSIELRFTMVQLAIEKNPAFDVTRVDVDRPGPHFTVDTLRILRQQHTDATIFLIIGSDSLADLPRWYQPQKLITQCELAVVKRPGIKYDLHSLDRQVPGLTSHIEWVDAPLMDISSTYIRQLVSVGLTIRYLVPSAVVECIKRHRLYQP